MALQFWLDREKGIVDPKLFSEKADELARSINAERTRTVNNPTQLRKFYDEVMRFQGLIQSSPEQFESLLPYIKMINAKAAYAAGRDLISTGFKNFLSESLSQIRTRKDFEIFCSLFEAFLGFYKYYAEKEKAQGGGGHHQNPGQHGGGQRREYVPGTNRNR